MTHAARKSTVQSLSVSAFAIPTDSPEADGTLAWEHTVLVTVELEGAGERGFGYTYADEATARLIQQVLAPVVLGSEVACIPGTRRAMRKAVRNLGARGVAAMAISAVDTALWDLNARRLGLPLNDLLGRCRQAVPAYGSGGFTSYGIDRLQRQLAAWVASGLGRVKMKVGSEPEKDPERVRLAREAVGPATDLFVDANGAYARKQALELAERFAQLGVVWFEEPVSSDDLPGLRLLRDRAPSSVEIAAGEYGYDSAYFLRMMQAGAVDVLQADATRCGGVSGFLDACALADACGLPLSAHCAPSLHTVLACSAARVRHVEYFHDHARIESEFFEGAPQPERGLLAPAFDRAGLGFELRRRAVARFEVFGGRKEQS